MRRDSPWWSDAIWVDRDRDLRAAEQSGLTYDPTPLDGIISDGLYLLYGPRRVGKTVAIKRTIQRLLSTGVDPLRGVTHHRSGQAEIDFVGRCADNGEGATPLDGKYTSGSWKRDALSIRNSTFGRGILATRDVLSVDPTDPVWAVLASFITYALADPV